MSAKVPPTPAGKLLAINSIYDYGAVPGGVTDNASSLTTATASANAVSIPVGTWKTSSVTIAGSSRINGSRGSILSTVGDLGYGISFANLTNNQQIDGLRLTPAAGSATHNGIFSTFNNNPYINSVQITGYRIGVWLADGTASNVSNSNIGAGCNVAVSVTGATNDSLFSNNTIAYPTYCGYYLGGGQANRIQGGETACADGGTPISIDRSSSVTVANHNTESQPTGGTPRAFYEIGNSGVSVISITPGSGYTDGTYDLTATGGNCAGFYAQATVTGGAVASVRIVAPGWGGTVAPTLALPASAGAGVGAAFTCTLGTTTGTHNTYLDNINIIANKGNVADAIVVRSPVFGLDINKVRIAASKITNSVVKFFTTNATGRIGSISSSGKGASVADIEIAAESPYFAGGKYNIGIIWDFLFNKGFKILLAGTQARAYFPAAVPAPIIDIDVATDTNIGALSIRSRNGDPHVTTYDPSYVAGPPAVYNNAVAGGRITFPTRKKLKYTGDFTIVAFVRVSSLGSGFCGIAQRQGSWVLRGSANNTTMPQVMQAQCTIGGVTYSINSSASLAANTWVMLVVKRDTAATRLYIQQNETVSYNSSVPATALDGSSGNHLLFNRDGSASASFLGDIALYSEYDRLLTMGEIKYLYQAMTSSLGLTAWAGAETATDPGTTNLVLKVDPASYSSSNPITVPDSSPNAYSGYFGASKGLLLTHQIDAKTGMQRQGNGTDLEGSAWRDLGMLDDDPSTIADGDQWIRSDLSPPERRYRIAGVTYKVALTAA